MRKGLLLCVGVFLVLQVNAETYYVAKSGSNDNHGTEIEPWLTIQKAADTLAPGDTVLVKAGVYNEKIVINVNGVGSEYITFKNYPDDTVFIDGTGVPAQHMIYMNSKNYIRIIGFHITNNTGGSGIFIEDSGDYIEIRDNTIHNMKGPHGMGITVYAHSSDSITHLKLDNNEIYDCEPATSEALVVNGNVLDFELTNNKVHDVNNIGIDVIGGEVGTTVAKRGLVKRNVVYRARSSYGGGYAAGIYVDGGSDIIIESNIVYESDMGIEIGCENAGFVVTGCVVRNNLLFNNDKAGLAFGGYAASTGRAKNCTFINNTLYKNQVKEDGEGELWIQCASENIVENNIIYAGAQGILLSSWDGNVNNILNYNCWLPSIGSHPDMFIWNGTSCDTYDAYKAASEQDTSSIQGNPEFVNETAYDFHLQQESPCIDAGNPNAPTCFDFDGIHTPQDGNTDGDSTVDIGAYEYIPAGVESKLPPALAPEFFISPNPTGRIVQIEYTLPKEGYVEIKLYDSSGRSIKTLVNETLTSEHYVVNWDVESMPNGIYFIVLRSEGYKKSQKITLIH